MEGRGIGRGTGEDEGGEMSEEWGRRMRVEGGRMRED